MNDQQIRLIGVKIPGYEEYKEKDTLHTSRFNGRDWEKNASHSTISSINSDVTMVSMQAMQEQEKLTQSSSNRIRSSSLTANQEAAEAPIVSGSPNKEVLDSCQANEKPDRSDHNEELDNSKLPLPSPEKAHIPRASLSRDVLATFKELAKSVGCSNEELLNYIERSEYSQLSDEAFRKIFPAQELPSVKSSPVSSPTRKSSISNTSSPKKEKFKKAISVLANKKEKRKDALESEQTLPTQALPPMQSSLPYGYQITKEGMQFLINYFKAQRYPLVNILRAKQEELHFQNESLLSQQNALHLLQEAMQKIQELIERNEDPLTPNMWYNVAKANFIAKLECHDAILQLQQRALHAQIKAEGQLKLAEKQREKVIQKVEESLQVHQKEENDLKETRESLTAWQKNVRVLGQDRISLSVSIMKLISQPKIMELEKQISGLLTTLAQLQHTELNDLLPVEYARMVEQNNSEQKTLEQIRYSQSTYQEAKVALLTAKGNHEALNSTVLSLHSVPSKSTVETQLTMIKETQQLINAIPSFYVLPKSEILKVWLSKFKEVEEYLKNSALTMEYLVKTHKEEWSGLKLDLSVFQGKIEGIEELNHYLNDPNCPLVEIKLSSSMKKEEAIAISAIKDQRCNSEQPFLEVTTEISQNNKSQSMAIQNALDLADINNL